jgi:hypothetical protein
LYSQSIREKIKMTEKPAVRQHRTASEIARGAGSPPDVFFSSTAVDAMDQLPAPLIEPVAAAIARISRKERPDKELAITAPENPGEHYQVMIPDYPDAPVVVMYRRLAGKDERRGWLVAGLLDRDIFEKYENTEPLLATPGGKHGLRQAELDARTRLTAQAHVSASTPPVGRFPAR